MSAPTPTRSAHDTHGSYTAQIVSLENVDLLICDACHHIEAYCRHVKNSWNEEGTVLTCDFCGIDGT